MLWYVDTYEKMNNKRSAIDIYFSSIQNNIVISCIIILRFHNMVFTDEKELPNDTSEAFGIRVEWNILGWNVYCFSSASEVSESWKYHIISVIQLDRILHFSSNYIFSLCFSVWSCNCKVK